VWPGAAPDGNERDAPDHKARADRQAPARAATAGEGGSSEGKKREAERLRPECRTHFSPADPAGPAPQGRGPAGRDRSGFGQGDRSSGTNAARHGSADGEQTGASAPERDPEGPTGAERPPPEPGEGAGGNAGPFFASAATHWRRVCCCRERQRKPTTAGPNRTAATRQRAGRTEPSRAGPAAGHAPGAGDRSRTGARPRSGPGRRRRR
jgi:hypothetical protein